MVQEGALCPGVTFIPFYYHGIATSDGITSGHCEIL